MDVSTFTLKKIVSGGQTGADRAGLDWAIANDVAHGGWCPKGRKALDGPLDGKYLLTETPSAEYLQRTEWNVRDSDGTVVFTLGSKTTGGSAKTMTFARKWEKAVLHVHQQMEEPELALAKFIRAHSITILNVAGTREAKEAGIYDWTRSVLDAALRC